MVAFFLVQKQHDSFHIEGSQSNDRGSITGEFLRGERTTGSGTCSTAGSGRRASDLQAFPDLHDLSQLRRTGRGAVAVDWVRLDNRRDGLIIPLCGGICGERELVLVHMIFG